MNAEKLPFHKDFKLNNEAFKNSEEIIQYAQKLDDSIFSFLNDWFNNKEYLTVQTSGSTGKPKPILLKKEFMVNSAKATGAFFNLKPKTTALLCLSANYIAGKMMLVRAMVLGWQLDVILVNSNPLKEIEKQYDFSAMVPMQLRASLNELHKIKQLIVGGGVVASDLQELIKNKPTQIFATYGMTETITHIAVKKLNNFKTKKEDVYRALPNVKLSIDDRNCLVIEAPKVTSEKIITNDVVNLLSEIEFTWLGRFDNVINSGGIKLHPEKIEGKLSKIIKQRFFVTGIPDSVLGEKLILIIEGLEDENTLNQIKTSLTLSKYQTPKEIYFVKDFIQTETQKIQRKKTIELLNLF